MTEFNKNIKKKLVPDYTPEEMEQMHQNYLNDMRRNPNNYSIWSPMITKALNNTIRMAKHTVLQLPDNIIVAFFGDNYKQDFQDVKAWVEEHVMPVVNSMPDGPIFIKNGCYSGKFDAGSMCIINERDPLVITNHLFEIMGETLIYETGGNTEIVIEEYIAPKQDTPTIYNGLPLRPEMRLFYDFTHHKVIYHKFYWDWDYCYKTISGRNEQDGKVFEEYYKSIYEQYVQLSDKYVSVIKEALAHVDKLCDIWSVDFILEDNKVWLIDMAIGCRSAYYDPNIIAEYKKQFAESENNDEKNN